MIASDPEFYVTSGTVRTGAASYVERQADTELLEGLLRGDYCYVLDARQRGKSSLVARTAKRLGERGVAVVSLELSEIGTVDSAEQWCRGLLEAVGRSLNLRAELRAFWSSETHLNPITRWMTALREVVLPRCPGQLVLFLDEIDAVFQLHFSTDQFFAAIRAAFNKRNDDPEWARLAFCLIGATTPSDLIQDVRLTPFNVGRRIILTDFTEEEAAPLAAGLGREERRAKPILSRVLYWTGGHPYLTQTLCRAVAADPSVTDAAGVDRVCSAQFFQRAALLDERNLADTGNRLLKSDGDLASLLDLYSRIHRGRRVPNDETAPLVRMLLLSGMITRVEGCLRVRNRIYESVFDQGWVREHMPDAELRRQRAAYRHGQWWAFSRAGVVILTLGCSTLFALSMRKAALNEQKQALEKTAQLTLAVAQIQNEKRRAETATSKVRERESQLRIRNWKLSETLRAVRVARHRADQETTRAEGEKQRADSQARLALAEKRTAEHETASASEQARSATQAQEGLSVSKGIGFVEAGDLLGSIHWFADALGLDQSALMGDPVRAAQNRMRLASVLQYSPQPIFISFHHSDVTHAAFSPDGRYVVMAANEPSTQVWNVETRQPVTPPLEHLGGYIYTATFSPDGKRVVTAGGDRTARIWDAATGKTLAILPHAGWVFSAVFSPDGRRVATAVGDADKSGSAQVWDAATGTPITMPLPHPGWVVSVGFSPDSRRVVTACYDGAARVWDGSTGKQICTLQHASSVRSAEFSPDGRRIVTASDDKTACIWNADTGDRTAQLAGHMFTVYDAKFSPDSRRVVTASFDNTARIWDTETGRLLVSLPHAGGVSDAEFSPDGRFVLTTCYDGSAAVWDAEAGTVAFSPLRHSGLVLGASFSRGGNRIVTVGADRTTRVWDLPAQPGIVLAHSAPVNSAVFSPDGKQVVTASSDGTARTWEAGTGRRLRLLIHGGDVKFAGFSPDGRQVVTAGTGGVQLWDAVSGQPLGGRLLRNVSMLHAAFSPDGRYLATASEDGSARVWNLRSGTLIASIGYPFPVRHVEFSSDSRRVVIASGRLGDGSTNTEVGTVTVWVVGTQKVIRFPLQHAAIVDARFSPDGRQVVTACTDQGINPREATVWDATTGQQEAMLKHADGVLCAKFSPDGRRIITTSEDSTAKLWVAPRLGSTNQQGQLAAPPLKHHHQVLCADFSPDGRLVATACVDGTVRVWDAQTGEPISPPLNHGQVPLVIASDQMVRVVSVAFSPDGRHFVSAGSDGSAHLWSLAQERRQPAELERLAEVLDGRILRLDLGTRRLFPLEADQTKRLWQALRFRPSTARHPVAQPTTPAFGPQKAEAGLSPVPIDLRGHLTHRLLTPIMDLSALALDLPAAGWKTLLGVPFRIDGLVLVGPAQALGVPETWYVGPRAITGISIGRTLRRLYFLHGCRFLLPGKFITGAKVGAYRIHYADGVQVEIPLRAGVDFADWWENGSEAPGAEIAWRGTTLSGANRVRLYLKTWENPRPTVAIESLDLVIGDQADTSDAPTPFLVAVTAGIDDPAESGPIRHDRSPTHLTEDELVPMKASLEYVLRSGESSVGTSILFVNESSHTRKICWLSHSGHRVFYVSLAPKQSYLQPTFLTHPWLVTDDQDRGLAIFLPRKAPSRAVIRQ